MKTITASNANRGFSHLMREVSRGEEITILSRGTPVAKIISVDSEALQKEAMKKLPFISVEIPGCNWLSKLDP